MTDSQDAGGGSAAGVVHSFMLLDHNEELQVYMLL